VSLSKLFVVRAGHLFCSGVRILMTANFKMVLLAVSTCTVFSSPLLASDQQQAIFDRYDLEKKTADQTVFSVKAFDSDMKELKSLRAGQKVRLVVRADISRIPQSVDASLSADAKFTMSAFGRAVSYRLSLPALDVGADSTINPAVGTPGFGQAKVGAEWQNKRLVRSFVLKLPKEAPRGTVTVSVVLSATGLKTVKQEIRFPVVR